MRNALELALHVLQHVLVDVVGQLFLSIKKVRHLDNSGHTYSLESSGFILGAFDSFRLRDLLFRASSQSLKRSQRDRSCLRVRLLSLFVDPSDFEGLA